MKKLIKLYNKIMVNFKHKDEAIKMEKVLIVSNTALGDLLLSTPAIKTLRKSFPDIYIELLINKNLENLFISFEYVDKVITYESNFWGLIKHVRHIKKEAFDTIFFLHSNGPQDLFIALASNVRNILKAINYPSKISASFSKFILNKPDYNNKHIIEHRLDLVKVFNPKIIDKTISLPNSFYENYKKEKKLNIGIQLGAADNYKMWPLEKFVTLINRFDDVIKEEYSITFFGLKNEQKLSDFVISKINQRYVINLCGKTNIDELPYKLKEIDFLVTNDTGTLHLSIALNIPTISLFSPTDSKIFGPYQDFEKHIVIQKDGDFINDKPKKQRSQDAMNLIEVEEVLECVKLQLKRLNKCVA
ncbi:glycosyltransferase family 9 protein [Arcobacter sp.]|uniref:glycosyltransferase family 9 protein n=1 Tax=Arcobacter sp. TaxID=1872629 RepID=UPI003D0C97AC